MGDAKEPSTTGGAVDLDACQTRRRKGRRCRCGPCKVCGFEKHMAVHGPMYGEGPGSKPWGHEYVAADAKEKPRD